MQTVFMWTPGKGSRLYPGDDDTAAPALAAGRADIHPFRGPIPEALGLIWQAATARPRARWLFAPAVVPELTDEEISGSWNGCLVSTSTKS